MDKVWGQLCSPQGIQLLGNKFRVSVAMNNMMQGCHNNLVNRLVIYDH